MCAKLLLNNGMIFEGISFGAQGTAFGEICFNTAMSGYQEILTDPSYAQNVVVLTYPEIGNYGINGKDNEGNRVYPRALVVKNYCEDESHYMSEKTLSLFLKENNVVAISGIDTRKLVTIIRDCGSMSCLVTTEEITEEMKSKLKEWQLNKNITKEISTQKKYIIEGEGANFAVIDFGIKNSVLQNLINAKINITVFPADASAEEVLESQPDAILLSNGPGNPQDAWYVIENLKKLFNKAPIFAIGFGAQVASLALGCKTQKLKYGHRGGNHPILDLRTKKVILSSQNHDYAIDMMSLPDNVFVTYQNLNDFTLEGYSCPRYSVDAVQFLPETTANGNEINEIFQIWIEQVEGFKLCQKM